MGKQVQKQPRSCPNNTSVNDLLPSSAKCTPSQSFSWFRFWLQAFLLSIGFFALPISTVIGGIWRKDIFWDILFILVKYYVCSFVHDPSLDNTNFMSPLKTHYLKGEKFSVKTLMNYYFIICFLRIYFICSKVMHYFAVPCVTGM